MDNLTVEQRRKNMQQIRSKNTRPERIVMRELKRNKVYFAAHVDSLLGKPDIVFRRKRVAVFVDSDFWHGHPKRFRMPTTNQVYWSEKIRRNKERDKRVTHELRMMGWRVIRFWEYDIVHRLNWVMKRLLSAVDKDAK